jgi:hypothetical protein
VTDRQRHRLRGIKRTFLAAGALFSAVLVLMAAQLALGRDPAVRSGRAPSAQTAQAAPPAADSSIVDTILGLARSAISDDEGGDPSGESPPAVQTTSS